MIFLVSSTLLIKSYKKHFYPLEYREIIDTYCLEYSLDNTLVYSLINVESRFNKEAISNKGAVGLMQILPSTARFVSSKLSEKTFDLKNPKTNIRFGCYYLSYLQAKYSVKESMLCAYNAGEGKVNEWLKNKDYSPDGKNLTTIPYKETREYVKKIEKNYKRYSHLYKKTVDN